MTEQIKNIRALLVDMNLNEIGSQIMADNLGNWLRVWKDEMVNALDVLETESEKQIPKMAIKSKEPRYGMGEEYHDWICPTCGEWLAYSPDRRRFGIHHCYCGQKLDWGNEE